MGKVDHPIDYRSRFSTFRIASLSSRRKGKHWLKQREELSVCAFLNRASTAWIGITITTFWDSQDGFPTALHGLTTGCTLSPFAFLPQKKRSATFAIAQVVGHKQSASSTRANHGGKCLLVCFLAVARSGLHWPP